MKQKALTLFIALFLSLSLHSQFAPPAGQIGSTAIPFDSVCFTNWASHCTITRGYVNISDTTFQYSGSVFASYGEESWALGQADNQVVSLGDNGIAILEFNPTIANGNGWDFAVFENSLNDSFLELAFVEVSSDGINYFRFPATSLTPVETQTSAFGNTDATKINNLAGKYRALFGTPFNIDDIENNALLNKNNIRFVRIIDVVGSIIPQYASFDSSGNIINDPWPTSFNSCGFDLDAIGVINNTENTNTTEFQNNRINLYPNPVSNDIVFIQSVQPIQSITFFTLSGQIIKELILNDDCKSQIEIGFLSKGAYLVKIQCINSITSRLLIHK